MALTSIAYSNFNGRHSLVCHRYGSRPDWMDGGRLQREEATRVKQIVRESRRRRKADKILTAQGPFLSQPISMQTSEPLLFLHGSIESMNTLDTNSQGRDYAQRDTQQSMHSYDLLTLDAFEGNSPVDRSFISSVEDILLGDSDQKASRAFGITKDTCTEPSPLQSTGESNPQTGGISAQPDKFASSDVSTTGRQEATTSSSPSWETSLEEFLQSESIISCELSNPRAYSSPVSASPISMRSHEASLLMHYLDYFLHPISILSTTCSRRTGLAI
ncbi:hypothetical protein F5884DRAFT_744161 [Xylogone sp. PMI_703]|nr:hypothetical protein F5884DRAFT_744161 [Xylogone sp. PMI_703]